MSHFVQFMSLLGGNALAWKCHSNIVISMWVTTSKVVSFFRMLSILRFTITLNCWLCFSPQSLQSDGVPLRNEVCRLHSAFVESAQEKMFMWLYFRTGWAVAVELKRVGDGLLPEQSESWLRISNLCAPNHTAVLSARRYNQRNTPKSSLQCGSASCAGL